MATESTALGNWAGFRLKIRQGQMTAMAGFLALLALATVVSFRQSAPPQFEAPYAVGSWRWWLNPWEQNTSLRPAVTHHPLLSTAFVSAQSGWAVGDGGTTLHTEDGGTTWMPQTSGTQLPLSSVAFVSPQSGWAVGYGGTILTTQDGGTTWMPQTSGTQSWLNSVAFVSPQSGWAVGDSGTILHTADGGTSWTAQTSGIQSRLTSVAFTSPQSGWAVGGGGTMLHTEDGGASWQLPTRGTQQNLDSVAFVSQQIGWAVGNGGTILHTEDGGASWQPQTSGTQSWLNSVAFISPQSGWAVGEGGTILHTEDGGTSWKPQASGTQAWLDSAVFVSPQSGWAVGEEGTVLHTEDGGASWKPQARGIQGNLRSVTFVSPQSGWAVGEGGTILRSEDGGASWRSQNIGPQESLYSVAFVSPRSGWAVGDDTILHTEDGGTSWHRQTSGIQLRLASVAFVSPQSGWAAGGNGIILHTEDGGMNWKRQASGTRRVLLSTASASSQSSWVVGIGGTILHTADGGNSWKLQSSGTSEDLTSVALVSPQSGWAVGPGIILHTADGGLTWKRQGYRRWPAPWFAMSLIFCLAGLFWALQPLAPEATPYIEDLANADSPVAHLKYDALGYRPLVRRLLRFIQNPKTRPPLVLAVQAPWGMGKSSAMAMSQTELKSNRAAVTVWFNAWHHQKEDQLLAYLLEAIQKQVAPSWFSPVGLRFRFNLLRVRVFSSPERFLASVAALTLLALYRPLAAFIAALPLWSQFFQAHPNLPFAGPVIVGLLIAANLLRTFSSDPQKLLEKSTSSVWKTLRDLFVFPTMQGKADVRHDFARDLKEVTDALLPQRLVIFLDDLDRCRPDQVVQILEAINFLSSAAPCFIVVGADYRKVETLAGQHFEAIAVQEAENVALDNATVPANQPSAALARMEFAKNYMRKIVNMRLDLPHPTAKGYVDLIRQAGDSANYTHIFWQRAVVGLLLLACVASAVAISAGWVELPFGKPAQTEMASSRIEPMVARERGATASSPSPAGPEGKASAKTPEEDQWTSEGAPRDIDRDSVGVTWSHRLTIGVPLLIVLLFLVRLLGRPKEIEEAVDSKPFSEALDQMAPRIQDRCVTPREVRRFQNYLRFLAAWDESANRPKVTGLEADLVYLAATGIKAEDGSVRTDIPREVIDFFSEQCDMLGLDPNTFRPIEERTTRPETATS